MAARELSNLRTMLEHAKHEPEMTETQGEEVQVEDSVEEIQKDIAALQQQLVARLERPVEDIPSSSKPKKRVSADVLPTSRIPKPKGTTTKMSKKRSSKRGSM